ncbi:MAG: hypothetical protein JO276_00585 [Sphingomonadaceae bacterium]|nr:hypothetical protein [Sphingomonadaceae bacterium]
MSGRGRWQLLCGLWLLFLLVYLVWGGIAQAGLYYWVGTLEVDRFGSYDPMMTGLVPGLLLALPALWFLAREARRARQAPPADPGQAGRSRRLLAIFLCAAGAAALAAAIAFYLAAEAQPGGGYESPVPFDPAQLAAGPVPAHKVRIAGTIDEGAELRIHEGSRGSSWTMIYSAFRAAKTGEGWPLRLFVERREEGGSGRDVVYWRDGGEQGYLVEDGLPPLVRYAFERRGLQVARPNYLLRTGSDALRTPYYVGAALTTLLGWMLAGAGVLLLVLSRRGRAGTIAEGPA